MEKLCILEEKGELAEAYGWLFVDFVPLLYEKRRVARQLQVEAWLDLSMLTRELGIERQTETRKEHFSKLGYIV